MDILQRYYLGFDDTKLTTEEVSIVDDMVKEIERLKKIELLIEPAVKAAYDDGWCDGNSEECDGEIEQDWKKSLTFKALQGKEE